MNRIVLPGEMICTIEEWAPGKNVFEENGRIYSKTLGITEFDKKNMTVNVKPVNDLPELKVGDIVYGVVQDLFEDFALVTVISIEGVEREIVGSKQDGIIHISKVSNKYIDEIGKAFRIGDIVRAKVIRAKPSLQLTTNQPNLGVVKALCMKCRSPLVRKNDTLYCERCERTEIRKIASDYGNIKIKVKNEPIERMYKNEKE